MTTFMVIMYSVNLTSCGGSDNDEADDKYHPSDSITTVSNLEKNYLSLDNAIYHEGNFPTVTTTDQTVRAYLSKQIVAGEVNNVTVESAEKVNTIFIGVKGIDGYLSYSPLLSNGNASSEGYSYVIPVKVKSSFPTNSTILISAQFENGRISVPVETGVTTSDPDDEEKKDSVRTDELTITEIAPVPENLKPFIGYWRTSNKSSYYKSYPNYGFWLFQDGVCKVDYYSLLSNYSCLTTWNYNSSTGIFAIAGMSDAQWQITSMSNYSWSGLSLWGRQSTGYSAGKESRDNNGSDILDFWLYGFGWNCDTVTAQFYKSYYLSELNHVDVNKSHTVDGKKVDTYSVWYRFYFYDGDIAAGESITLAGEADFDEERDCYILQRDWGTPEKRFYIQLVHPYSYNDCYMNIIVGEGNEQWAGKFLPTR